MTFGNNRLAILIIIALCGAALAAWGCFAPSDRAGLLALQDELAATEKRMRDLERDNQQLTRQLEQINKQLQTLQEIGEARIDFLPKVEDIRLSRRTSGIDTDGENGHDAVKVFLEPLDSDGHVIKAPGRIKIRIFDLAGQTEEVLIGELQIPPDELSRHWSSGFATNHYSFVVPVSKPPAGPEVTVRVEFTDYLFGKTLSRQMVARFDIASQKKGP